MKRVNVTVKKLRQITLLYSKLNKSVTSILKKDGTKMNKIYKC